MPRLKELAIKAVSRQPIYRIVPPSAARSYAALRYHAQNSSRQQISQLIERMNGIPIRYHSTAIIATRAAFRAGHDDLVLATLDRIAARFPESAAQYELRCDLHTFYGRYQEAIDCARRARLLEPGSSAATARLVKLGYRCWSREEADQFAVEAVRRFPLSSEVLWAAARECVSADQYQRLREAWQSRGPEPLQLLKAVRQLAMAATRARQIDAAIDLYQQAIVLLYDNRRAMVQPAVRKLEGRGAWGAIEDIVDVLDKAGIPFFFAAGTALGLVREGRPIGADNDIDVGVFDEHWDRDALIQLFTQDPRFDLDLHPLSKKVCLRHRGASPVDIFRFYEEGGRIWHDGVFVRWDNTPFRVVRREIRGLSLSLPEDADTYLRENYGDWRTPNSAFDPFTDQAPNVEVTWPEHQRLHLIRRAYKQLTTGNVRAARASLQLAGAGDLAERIGGVR